AKPIANLAGEGVLGGVDRPGRLELLCDGARLGVLQPERQQPVRPRPPQLAVQVISLRPNLIDLATQALDVDRLDLAGDWQEAAPAGGVLQVGGVVSRTDANPLALEFLSPAGVG